ncbi:MAG: helix-turn-helix domain-containing protein [Pseudomonadota bacterium]
MSSVLPLADCDAHTRDAVDIVKSIAAEAFGVQLCEIDAPTRSKAHIAFARQAAMYLAHVVYGLSLTDVAAAFQRDRTTVSHACHLVEDRRDEMAFDRLMERLEREVSVHAAPPRRRAASGWLETKSARAVTQFFRFHQPTVDLGVTA